MRIVDMPGAALLLITIGPIIAVLAALNELSALAAGGRAARAKANWRGDI